jgi:lysozyme family protein
MALTEKQLAMGHAIVEMEGRFEDGKLQVYKLPIGDGGGSFEVAGINERYHGAKAKELRQMINSDKHEEAHHSAAAYIAEYTNPICNFFPSDDLRERNPGIEFILRDSAFNRGAKGAATILQIALGVSIDGVVGTNTKAAFAEELERDQEQFMVRLRTARETYERTKYPWKSSSRDESSKFWSGLSNRWAKSHNIGVSRFV